jgi:hypothetical protein
MRKMLVGQPHERRDQSGCRGGCGIHCVMLERESEKFAVNT